MPANSNKKGVADCIRHFTPAWFAVNMGTGAISLLFSVFPYWTGSHALRALSTAFFFLNLLLFVLFCGASAVRYWCFLPGAWRAMLRHPVQGLYVGTFPMGALTLIAVGTTVLHGQYGFGGRAFLYVLWGFWWADVAISALCCWGIIYLMITEQKHPLRDMTTLWLLPVVTLVVASSGGGELAQALAAYTTTGALTTLASATCTLSAGLALASALLIAYLLRLLQHGFPTSSTGVLSACVPLGPMGQAGVAALLLGEGARVLLPRSEAQFFAGNEGAAQAVYAVCVCVALALWALATLWLGFALLGIQYTVRREGGKVPPFQLAYWGLIFPNGVYANLTIALAQVLDAGFFRVWGALYAVLTLLLWIAVFSRTVVRIHNGRIFDVPVPVADAASSSSETETTTTQDRGPVPVVDDQEKTRGSIC